MNEPFPFAAAPAMAELVVALDGFEGPIDLLLSLAREQKVDLSRIAILPLAEQYLAFIEKAHKLRLEIAADYLVMAAWLTYLKSRLVLPERKQKEDQSETALMADALRFQLQRLAAIQKAAEELKRRPRLGIDVFVRGAPEEIAVDAEPLGHLTVEDLVQALGSQKLKSEPPAYVIAPLRLYSIEESAARLRTLLGASPEWSVLQNFLPERKAQDQPLETRSALASTFAATLELVRNGEVELRQDGLFGPIDLRRRVATLNG
jgi:segregation and condensation protein A